MHSNQNFYVNARFLVLLISLPVVNLRTINSDNEESADEIVHPLTLKGHSGSRHKRSVDCRDLECRSLCPWTWVPDSHEGRDPQLIFRAECLNQTCNFDFSGVGHRTRRKLQVLTECELVYTDIKVWQDEYPKWIPWPIACACSRTRSRTMMRLGDGVVISEFNRHRQTNTGVRAIDADPEDQFDVQINRDTDVQFMPGHRLQDNDWK